MTNLFSSIMKKCLAVTVASVFVFTGSASFAMGHVNDYPSVSAVMTEGTIDEAVGTENVDKDLKEDKNGYHSEGDNIDVDIPKDPEDGITMDSKGFGSVSMGLPEEVAGEKAEMVDGTVMFESSDEDVTIAVQTEKGEADEEAGDNAGTTIRSLVVIDSDKAPKEYSFGFDLKKGQSLKYAQDESADTDPDALNQDAADPDAANQDTADPDAVDSDTVDQDKSSSSELKGKGKIYVMEGKEPVCEIQPAWAKDADGKEIDTHYEIRDNELVQIVEFDENTRFPVVADPTFSGYYYRKKNVSIKDKMGGWKRTSSIMNTYGTKGGTLSTNEAFTISGSVSGCIKGIATIGVGASFSSAIDKTWKIGKNKRCYLICRAEYKVEKGTREKVNWSTGKVVERNKYTVKRPKGRVYREHKVRNIKK